jgi:hypothetical protein
VSSPLWGRSYSIRDRPKNVVDYEALHKHLWIKRFATAKYLFFPFVRKSALFDSFSGEEEFQIVIES